MKPEDSLIGRHIDEYRLVSLLGTGGMARVYLGLDTRLKRYVAIKIVDAPYRGHTEYRERFRREAQAVAQLQHPNIIHLYHYGEVDDLLYMAMPYVEGANLAHLIYSYRQEGAWMPASEVARLVREIGQALDYAHRHGVIHRDVKPSNIMLEKTGRAILTDFGLALLVEVGTEAEVFGTPHYMAPEQVQSSAAAGPASDLYSLGIILYEMLTGEVPFDSENPMDVAVMQVNEAPRSPRDIRPDLSPAVAEVILKAIAKEPEARYAGGAALAAALDGALQALPPTAPSRSVPERVTQAFERDVRPLLPAAMALPLPPVQTGEVAAAMPPAPDETRGKTSWLYTGGGVAGLLFLCLLLSLLAVWFSGAGSGRAALNDMDLTADAGDPVTIADPALTNASATGTALAMGGSPATPTIAPTATLRPTATPTRTPTPEPEVLYELLLARHGDDSLFVVNRSGRAMPLPPLWLTDGRAQANGQEWQVPSLESGACVTAWKDSGRPKAPDVTCTEVGEPIFRSGRDRFWRDDFEIYYDGHKVGDCPKNQEQCVVTIGP
jgi:tRNA A-37 threonylcarbamoyl transferase component Bud32